MEYFNFIIKYHHLNKKGIATLTVILRLNKIPLEPVRPGGEVGSGGYKAGGILLAFELCFVKVFVGAVFFCHQFVVGACFNDFAVV